MKGRATLVAIALACALAPGAEARVRVGDVVPVRLESPHPVEGPWRSTLSVPGATLVKVRISRAEMGPQDVLRLLDASGQEVYRTPGCDVPPWLPAVTGDACVVEVLPGPGSRSWGLAVEEVAAAWPGLLEGTAESICGVDDRRNARCYPGARYDAGRAVGRMVFSEGGGLYLCTGSLVSSAGHFLTNNHCVSTEQGADSLEVWWLWEYPACEGGAVAKDSITRGADLLLTDEPLDCSLLLFSGGANPARTYGHLELDPSEPQLGKVIWIPQHPSGGPKSFAVLSDMDGGGPATVRLPSADGTNGCSGCDVGYYADTQGGSSGSPVLGEDNRVVALHHWGTAFGPCTPTDMNQGVKMSRIYPLIEPFLRTCELGCSASVEPTAYRGAPAPFAASATGPQCQGQPTFFWEFGDGSTSDQAEVQHAYGAVGTYGWTLTVTWAGAECVRTGAVEVFESGSGLPGDCDGDGSVSIGEVQKAINMFLGLLDPACGVDCGGEGTVSIGEVQKVVNAFLGLPSAC